MRKTILIVEDDEIILKFVAYRLEYMGYHVLTAFDGEKAMGAVKGKKPDLVLLDVLIPGISGYEVCRRMKSDPQLKHIPVILFTAGEPEAVGGRKAEVNADDYIVKPFEPEELLAKIRKLTGEEEDGAGTQQL